MASENVYPLSEPSHAVSVERIGDTVQVAVTGPVFATSIVFSPGEARTVGAALIGEARKAERRD
ncbi:MAG TPA: hypothetical protein VFQ12_03855 [Thermoleophilaceae bacterium]|nr:hypothetical protein [Thermoleophilaceae bacterium]